MFVDVQVIGYFGTAVVVAVIGICLLSGMRKLIMFHILLDVARQIPFRETSMVTAKPAMRGRLKTGHVKWPKTGVVLPCRSEFGKAGFGRAVTC